MINKVFAIGLHFKYLFDTFFWFALQIYRGNFRNYLLYKKRERKLIILATGPSLGEVLVNDLREEELSTSDLCVVNDFCKHPMYGEIKPVIYVLADPLYFSEEIMRKAQSETIEIISQTNWEMNVYVPFNFVNKIKSKIESNFVHVYPYHCNLYLGWNCVKNYLYEKGLSMPKPQNVLIPSIFNGINLGYSTIELYGADHSWTKEIRINRNNQVCLCDRHFYDKDEVALSPWLKCTGEQYLMQEILRDLAFMFEGYHELRKYADMKGCHIINMTKGSFIDAFDRRKSRVYV